MAPQQTLTRVHLFLLFLALTAGIAAGLSLFSSASTIISLIRTATAGLFLPILLSLIVTSLLGPLVTRLERKKISRANSIFLIYLLGASLLLLALSWLSPDWKGMWESLRTDLPRYLAQFVTLLREGQETLRAHFPYVENYDLPGRARALAEQLLAAILVETPKSALRLGSLIILVPLFSFFFLRDGNRILRACVALTPNRHFEMAHDLSYLVIRQMGHFIRGRILEAFIVGLVVTVGLSFTDIRYAPILGFFAGITNLIPYVGPFIGVVPGILIALVDLGMGGQFWWIVIVYVLIAQVIVDIFILIPILISRVSNLHPLWVLLAIIMGGQLYGVLGMIIGVPVASTIKIALLEIRHYRSTFALPDTASESDRLT